MHRKTSTFTQSMLQQIKDKLKEDVEDALEVRNKEIENQNILKNGSRFGGLKKALANRISWRQKLGLDNADSRKRQIDGTRAAYFWENNEYRTLLGESVAQELSD